MRYFNPIKVARMLNISDKTVRRHIQKGTIEASRKASGELKIAEDQIEKLREVLGLDQDAQPSPDIDLSRQIARLNARVNELESRLVELESKHTQPQATEKPYTYQLDQSHTETQQSHQIAIVGAKSSTAEPQELMTAVEFCERYSVKHTVLEGVLRHGISGTELECTKVPHPTRKKRDGTPAMQYFFSRAQAEKAIEVLRRHGKTKETGD